MPRTVGWFSCGAASAVAMKLTMPDVIAYCETGSEDADNERFLEDCEDWFGKHVTRLKSDKYASTWEVWEDRQYLAGIDGAPCTKALKIEQRLAFQRPDDIHIFGYTADWRDTARAQALREDWPDLTTTYPLIDKGITKAACLAMIQQAGLEPPRTYAMGFPCANCIPCVKATSPDYWALVRKEFPQEFDRMAKLARRVGKDGARLARINDERTFIDDIPADWPTTEPIQPECDFLCQLAEQDMSVSSEPARAGNDTPASSEVDDA